MDMRTRNLHNRCVPEVDARGCAGKSLNAVLTSAWNNFPGKAKDCEDNLCFKILLRNLLQSTPSINQNLLFLFMQNIISYGTKSA